MMPRLVEETALRIRCDAAWRAAAHADDVDERILLLSYAVWPTTDLLRLSRERAARELYQLRGRVG